MTSQALNRPVDVEALRVLVDSWREREAGFRIVSGDYYAGKVDTYSICADALEDVIAAIGSQP